MKSILILALFLTSCNEEVKPKLCGKVTEKVYFVTDKQKTPYNIILSPYGKDEIMINVSEREYKSLVIGQVHCTNIDSTKYFK
jgi:hypothetical protein